MWTLFLYSISSLLIAVMGIWSSSSVYDRCSANLARITLAEIEVMGTADTASRDIAIFKTKARTALIALGKADDAANATPAPWDFRYADIRIQFELFGFQDVNRKIGETDVSFRVKRFFAERPFFEGAAT